MSRSLVLILFFAKNVSGIEGGLDVPEQGEDSASSSK